MAIDLFANNASATVSSGGTTAPAAGTSESWTLSGITGALAASSGATQMRIVDPAAPGEVMLLTNLSGTAATVTRAIEGTSVAHAAGFTVKAVASASALSYLAAPRASNRGMLATNNPQGWINSGVRYTTNGGILLIRLDIYKDTSISSISMQINNGLTTGTAGENFIGVYDAQGNLLWTSADLTAALAAGGSTLTVSVSARTIKASEGYFYVAILQNWGAGGAATNFYGVLEAAYVVSGLTAYHFGLNGGPWTSLPAAITPSSQTQNNVNGYAPWVAVK